ncbi:MAG: MarR family transcriptional regulator [Coriobacteriales bacterium]|jgi:DNA-binding MarR family transcriptional regulator|nr:MarR family transcriptional regulator [Coriobacteriales bacterium]
MEFKYPLTTDLLALSPMWAHQLRGELLPCDLTISQLRLLSFLAMHHDDPRPSQLAQALQMKPNSVRFVVERLVERGLIRREDSSSRARSKSIRVLPRGIDCLNNALEATERVANRLMDPLGPFLCRNLYEMANDYLAILRKDALPRTTVHEHPLGIGILLSDTLFASTLFIRNLLRAYGLSLTEFRVLFELNECPSGLHPSELAVRLLVPLPDLTVAIAHLSDQGFINVARERLDKRAILAELSSRSFALICQALPSIDRFYCEASSGFPPINRFFVLKTASLMSEKQRRSFRY